MTARTRVEYLTRVQIDAGATLSAVMVRETAEEMALKGEAPRF